MEPSPGDLDWTMGSSAARLLDWQVAAEVGRRVAGPGIPVPAAMRAEVRGSFEEIVPAAEAAVSSFTGIATERSQARAWVMGRGEWVRANLRGLQGAIEPLARRIFREHPPRADLRRKALGAEVGVMIGYVARKVLGQYDLFLPPDDEGTLYFVGPNVVEMERRFRLPARDFREWIALHEVTHRVQFAGASWLRGYVAGAVETYLETVELDLGALLRQARRAADEARTSDEWRDLGWIFLLMNEEQRDLFQRMQAAMSLLEGHASFVMNRIGGERIPSFDRLRRVLKQRRRATGLEKAFQRAIGFDTKVRQYDAGERFVQIAVERAGMDGFNRVWEGPEALPALEEIAHPDLWVARIAER